MSIRPEQILPEGDEGNVAKVINGKLQFTNKFGFSLDDKILNPQNLIGADGEDTNINISHAPLIYPQVFRNNSMRSIGDGVTTKDCYFVDPTIGGPHSFSTIAVSNHTLALKTNNPWSWGTNTSGKLGDNTTANRSSPISIIGTHAFTAIGAGTQASLGLKSDGTVWAWGSDATFGALGDNSTVDKSSPISVLGAHSFTTINAGANRFVALKGSDGTAWGWGSGSNGELGQSTSAVSRSSPVSAVGGHSFTILCTGNSNNIALKANNGTAWCWGFGTSGALGESTSAVSRSSPVSAAGGHSFTSINAGGDHVLALKSDGSIWGWGLGTSGQLGQGTSAATRSSPVSVVGAHSFIQIIGGSNHSFGLKSDGSVWAWGINTGGQCGDNTSITRSSPVSVLGTHSFIVISGNNNTSAGLKSDGSVWSWGTGSTGQFGNNLAVNRSSPVSVMGPVGGSPKSFIQIAAGDRLIWNGTISGVTLVSTDKIDLNYVEKYNV